MTTPETKPKKDEPAKKETGSAFGVKEQKKREEIERLFSRPDPVRALLESSPNAKAQSVYSRVYVWKKHYPDLEKKYGMLDRFRFLWSKPYDRMTAGEALKELYSEKKEEAKLSEQDKRTVPLFGSGSDDTISLEDFLGSVGEDVERKESEPKPAVKMYGNGDLKEAKLSEQDKRTVPLSGSGSEGSKMETVLRELEKEKQDCVNRIEQIEKKIEAIRIVQELIQ